MAPLLALYSAAAVNQLSSAKHQPVSCLCIFALAVLSLWSTIIALLYSPVPLPFSKCIPDVASSSSSCCTDHQSFLCAIPVLSRAHFIALATLDSKSVFSCFSPLSNIELHEDRNHVFFMFIFPASNTELNNAWGIESNGMCGLKSMRHGFIKQVWGGFPSSLYHKRRELFSCFQMHWGYNPPITAVHENISTRLSIPFCGCCHIIQTNPHFAPAVNNLPMFLSLQPKGETQVMLCSMLQRSKRVSYLLSGQDWGFRRTLPWRLNSLSLHGELWTFWGGRTEHLRPEALMNFSWNNLLYCEGKRMYSQLWVLMKFSWISTEKGITGEPVKVSL